MSNAPDPIAPPRPVATARPLGYRATGDDRANRPRMPAWAVERAWFYAIFSFLTLLLFGIALSVAMAEVPGGHTITGIPVKAVVVIGVGVVLMVRMAWRIIRALRLLASGRVISQFEEPAAPAKREHPSDRTVPVPRNP